MRGVDPGRNRFGQLIRYSVVDAVRQVLMVGEPGAVVGEERVLIAELQAMRTGDMRQGRFPQVGTVIRRAEVLRSIREAGYAAVRRTGVGALLHNANQVDRRIRSAFEVADSQKGAAEARVECETVRDDRRPCRLSDA